MRCKVCGDYFQSEYEAQETCGDCIKPEEVKFEPAYPGDLSLLLRHAWAASRGKHPMNLRPSEAKMCQEYLSNPSPRSTMQRVSHALYGILPEKIDALAYDFWSVSPKQIDEWEKTAPKMPEEYPGGMLAWYFACKMRELFGKEPA